MGRVEGKVAIITGGTSGIGLATALEFLNEGAEAVLIVGRDEERGKDAIEYLRTNHSESADGIMEFFKCDVTDVKDIERLKKHVISEFGKVDILFNNAGILKTGALEELTDEEWDEVYETNVKATVHMCQTFMDILKVNKGVVLNNASNVGLHSYIIGRKNYMYASSKAALIQITKHLAKNYAPEVRVNVLCPGITETNIYTNRDFSRFDGINVLGRIGKSEEIAKVALFLCSDEASFITGATIVADGGETVK